MKWWIDEPAVLGCSNPTTEELKKRFQEGFRSIISLLDEKEQRPNYDLKEVDAMGFKRYSIPLKDFSAPTEEQFEEFLSRMNQALKDGKVLVHCQGGSGRTGTMAAAYWINKGLSAAEAIKKVRSANPNAIENTVQEKSLFHLESLLASARKMGKGGVNITQKSETSGASSCDGSIKAVCFDFRGVIVDHRNDRDLIPGIDEMIKELKGKGLRLAVVSSFPEEMVRKGLGDLQSSFDGIYHGSKGGKLECIKKFAENLGIPSSKVAFIDDKPDNFLPAKSEVYVIAFRGSGKYEKKAQEACKKSGIPYAKDIEELKKLLFAKIKTRTRSSQG